MERNIQHINGPVSYVIRDSDNKVCKYMCTIYVCKIFATHLDICCFLPNLTVTSHVVYHFLNNWLVSEGQQSHNKSAQMRATR